MGGGGKGRSFDLGYVMAQSQFLPTGDGRGRRPAYRDVVLDQIYVLRLENVGVEGL